MLRAPHATLKRRDLHKIAVKNALKENLMD